MCKLQQVQNKNGLKHNEQVRLKKILLKNFQFQRQADTVLIIFKTVDWNYREMLLQLVNPTALGLQTKLSAIFPLPQKPDKTHIKKKTLSFNISVQGNLSPAMFHMVYLLGTHHHHTITLLAHKKGSPVCTVFK